MNRLILIGNGLDLSHGLKTKYIDFIVDYFISVIEKAFYDFNYEDDFLKIKRCTGNNDVTSFNFLKEVIEQERDNGELTTIQNFVNCQPLEVKEGNGAPIENVFEITIKSKFLLDLFNPAFETKKIWSDIEHFYYTLLVGVAKKQKDANWQGLDRYNVRSIEDLNSGFKFFKDKFKEYILSKVCSVDLNNCGYLPHHRYHDMMAEPPNEDELHEIERALTNKDSLLFLNFNYTHTVARYYLEEARNFSHLNNVQEIQIHGRAGNGKESIIFGYGDEMDEDYRLLERLNDNRYLDYIKSFGYFKTENYRKLERFINAKPFGVFIVGHSCGLSDGVMLNTIFENPNCKGIKIFYHKIDEKTDNYLELTQNISRHFKSKERLRDLLLPKTHSRVL